jgi:hypothetical protein
LQGFRGAIALVLRLVSYGLLWLAPDCSSWGFMNPSLCKRSEGNGFVGDVTYSKVIEGNAMAESSVFLILLAAARGEGGSGEPWCQPILQLWAGGGNGARPQHGSCVHLPLCVLCGSVWQALQEKVQASRHKFLDSRRVRTVPVSWELAPTTLQYAGRQEWAGADQWDQGAASRVRCLPHCYGTTCCRLRMPRPSRQGYRCGSGREHTP